MLRGNYTSVAKELVPPLVDLLALARPVFGGDLDKLLIVLVVAKAANVRFEDVLSGELYPSLRPNVRSIAESTGETVRRKVADLVAAGWIRRDGAHLSYTPEASRALASVRDAMIDAGVRLNAAVTALQERNR